MESASIGLGSAEIELVRGADVILVKKGFFKRIKCCHAGNSKLCETTIITLVSSAILRQSVADGSSASEGTVTPESKQVLLGAIPMEGMDVLIDLKREQLIVNSESPDITKMMLM